MLAMPLCFRSVYLILSACRSAARGRSLSPLFVSYFHSHNLTFERSSHSHFHLCKSLSTFMQVVSLVLVLFGAVELSPRGSPDRVSVEPGVYPTVRGSLWSPNREYF